MLVALDRVEHSTRNRSVCHDGRAHFWTMFDYQFWFPVLGLLIAGYAAFLQQKQVNLIISQTPKPDAAMLARPLWKSPIVIVMFILACLTWGPYVLTHFPTDKTTTIPNLGITIEGDADQFNRFLNATLSISIDGNQIYGYSPQKVMAVAFHWPTDRDIDDAQDLQKSQVLDIRKSSLTFYMNTSQSFLDLVNKGSPIYYAIIILPTNISGDSFSTMRQVKIEGAKILEAGSGGVAVKWRRIRLP
jgi:hypothetical protein